MLSSLVTRVGRAGWGVSARVAAADSVRCLTTTASLYQKPKGKPATPPPPPPADDGDDIVLKAAKDLVRSYREYANGIKGIYVPITGDDAAIAKFAEETYALRKKVGIHETHEMWKAMFAVKMKATGGNYLKYMDAICEGMEWADPNAKAAFEEIRAAVKECEKATGKPMDESNTEGRKLLQPIKAAINAKYKLGYDEKEEDFLKRCRFEAAKKQMADLRARATETIERLKALHGHPDIEVDLTGMQPKWN